MTSEGIYVSPRVELLPFPLVLDADEGRVCGKVSAVDRPPLDIAEQVRRARHWRQYERPGFQEALDADRQDGMILVNNGRNIERIGLLGLTRHPIYALRLVEF